MTYHMRKLVQISRGYRADSFKVGASTFHFRDVCAWG